MFNLPGDAYLPRTYVPDMRLKIDLYRRLARVSQPAELADFRAELIDRFGPPPPVAEHLLEHGRSADRGPSLADRFDPSGRAVHGFHLQFGPADPETCLL